MSSATPETMAGYVADTMAHLGLVAVSSREVLGRLQIKHDLKELSRLDVRVGEVGQRLDFARLAGLVVKVRCKGESGARKLSSSAPPNRHVNAAAAACIVIRGAGFPAPLFSADVQSSHPGASARAHA